MKKLKTVNEWIDLNGGDICLLLIILCMPILGLDFLVRGTLFHAVQGRDEDVLIGIMFIIIHLIIMSLVFG